MGTWVLPGHVMMTHLLLSPDKRGEREAIIAERFNNQGAQLVCYQTSIVGAHDEYGGTAWKDYDKEFRGIKAKKPSPGWDQIGLIT
ncbi:hypothetical protein NDU88_005676 [Pleurodeles waltl]|uniref:Uncharacterized protein n=1 Tax=Pleurodeles waltl TaxID=8319 RepID=A0AAV7MK45_PLEWA|nr:hypothetical protein NDU88_005676 [Pleurodeles waltl]